MLLLEAVLQRTHITTTEFCRYPLPTDKGRIRPEDMQYGQPAEAISNYENYLFCWEGNREIDCFKVVKKEDGYYLSRLGIQPRGEYFHELPAGPFASTTAAENEAISLLKATWCR
jgi:hypothetical protein